MKKLRVAATLIMIMFCVAITGGCTIAAGNEKVYFYERPAIGFTVEDEVVTNVDLARQDSLSLSSADGVVKVSPYGGKSLQIIEKRKLTGPALKESLEKMLKEYKLTVDKDTIDVSINTGMGKKQKPFYRVTDDIEVKIPETMKSLNIVAKSGQIEVSGLTGASMLNLTIDKGNIAVDKSKAYMMYATITKGDFDVNEFAGAGSYKFGRVNADIKDVIGNIALKSLSGDIVIEKADGTMNFDISSGNLTIRSSHIKKESMLYASTGSIDADLTDLDSSGKYTIKASEAEINLKLSETAGWSLLARSTNGSIKNNMGTATNSIKKSPTGEYYGDIRGGGPSIDVYEDMGSIVLDDK